MAADIKYCYEAYAKEGVQAFTFGEIEHIETPDKHAVRIQLKSANPMFAQSLAEPVAVIFPRAILEEDGDLKKPMIGTGALHAEGAHAQGAGRGGAESRLLRRARPVRCRCVCRVLPC